jgi:hypothetical protein
MINMFSGALEMIKALFVRKDFADDHLKGEGFLKSILDFAINGMARKRLEVCRHFCAVVYCPESKFNDDIKWF